MAKARIYGSQRAYTPNSRADMRHHRKAYQRGREIAQKKSRERRENWKEGFYAQRKN